MKSGKTIGFITSMVMLATLLLSNEAAISATRDLAVDDVSFWRYTITSSHDGPIAVYATDVDGDGDTDVLSAAFLAPFPPYDGKITWWENDGAQHFTEHTVDGYYLGAASVFAIDLDDDGDVDILGAALFAGEITWWENDGSENFGKHTIDGAFSGATSVYASDLDDDGDLDVLGAANNAGEIAWWENDGDESFSKRLIDNGFLGASSVFAADVDGDLDLDVLGAAYSAEEIAWWENDDQVFGKHTIASGFSGASQVYATDLNSDGDMDVLGAAMILGQVTWWENDGEETFAGHNIDDTYNGARSVYATDLDDDGDVDVLGAAMAVGEVTWWENDGDEIFSEHIVDGDFGGAASVYATDVDRDGDTDVLGAARSGVIAWWAQGVLAETAFLPSVMRTYRPPIPPPKPVLYAISNPDGDSSYTVAWSSAVSATSYRLEEDDNPAFSSPTVVYSGPDTSKSINVGAIGTYYYRVQASNEYGSSAWSDIQSVVVSIPPIEPGHYTGVDPTVSFDVTTDQRVCSFTIRVPFLDGTCYISFTECAQIQAHAFEFAVIDPWTETYENKIAGNFDTLTHAFGTYSIHWCGTTLSFTPFQGTWAATRQ